MMRNYTLEFNLGTRQIEKNIVDDYAIRYHKFNGDAKVEIGYTGVLGLTLEADQWNRLVRIIKTEEVDRTGVKAIMSLTQPYLSSSAAAKLIDAIRANKIPRA